MERNTGAPVLTYGRKHQAGWNTVTTIAMAAFHAGAVGAFLFIDAGAIAAALVLYCVAGMLGIGMGYHRLLTHRGYKTYKWTEYFLAWCGTLALEGGPIFWVATHRIHHQHSDRDGDPHTPREGTWWAHAGWILSGEGLHHNASVLSRYVPDLVRDRGHVLLSRYHWTSNVIVGVALLRDDSTNNWWVALLTFGEGWHNNHHAHPTSARHGLAWYELDLNWIGIRTLQTLRLAWDVKCAPYGNARLVNE
jgi:stearoyl-CoA desaturase (delta-9 desaturase)